MAILGYPFEVRDSANTSTDNRKTGLTIGGGTGIAVSNGKTIAPSPATVLASTVTIVEIAGGHYAALYDAEVNGDASFPLDMGSGSGLTSPNDRYITLDLTRDSGRIIANLDAAVSTRNATTPPTTAAIAAAILATPAHLLATDASGFVTATNGGGGSITLGTLTVTGTPTTTSIQGTSGNMGTASGLYTGRRLYIPLAAGGYLLTGPCAHSYSAGTHTFAFATANTGVPAAGDVADVMGT